MKNGLSSIDLNGLGNFGDSEPDFTVFRHHLPRAWEYMYANSQLVLRLDQRGPTYAQLTPPSGAILLRQERWENSPPLHCWILADEDTPFSCFHWPNMDTDITQEPENFSCHYATDHTCYSFFRNGMKIETRMTILSDRPGILMKVTVKNQGAARKIHLLPVWRPHNTPIDLAPWDKPEIYQNAQFWEQANGILITTNDPKGNPENRIRTALLTDIHLQGVELDWNAFVGRGDFSRPEMVLQESKSNCTGSVGDISSVFTKLPVAAMQSDSITLAEDQTTECTIALISYSADQTPEKLNASLWEDTVSAYRQAITPWTSTWQLSSPDPMLDEYVNYWLPRQLYWISFVDRGWPTGMRGTRDAAQDYSGIVWINPEKAVKMLEEIFACQYANGEFLRQFSTQGSTGQHDARRYVDSGCWVFELLYDVLRFTQDRSLLDRPIRWLDDESPANMETHARQLLDFYLTPQNRGEHGLVKIWAGDWLDSVNNAGLKGRGESVMVSCHVVHLLKLAEELWPQQRADFQNAAQNLKANIRKYALNEEGFLNSVFSDHGFWAFSNQDPDGVSRPSIPANAFGLIAGVFEEEELPVLLERLDSLCKKNGYRLFYPPLGDPPIEGLGRIGQGELIPGAGENGTVYNHGSQGFLARAMAAIGEGDRMLDIVRWALPYDQTRHPVAMCRTAPYATVNHWMDSPGREGEGGDPFISGTISVIFRTIFEGLLGFKPALGKIKLTPCLPTDWDFVEAQGVYLGYPLSIRIQRGEHAALKLNEKPIEGQECPLDKLEKDSNQFIMTIPKRKNVMG